MSHLPRDQTLGPIKGSFTPWSLNFGLGAESVSGVSYLPGGQTLVPIKESFTPWQFGLGTKSARVRDITRGSDLGFYKREFHLLVIWSGG